MYSIVLAAVLTAGGSTPAWGHHRSCHGCWGGCYGCSGCYGCHGCYGCSGCYGCYGCSGCYGCYGGYSSCYGCSGCYGGCHGCVGSYGGAMMAPAPFRAAPGEPVPAPKEIKDAPAQPKKETNLGNKAQVIVQSPTDSRLIVDGRPIAVGSAPLLTPELEPNRDYYYVVQAQAMRDGVMVQEAQRVIVRAGHSSRVEFDLSNTAVARRQAAQPARITVQLPPDAKLFVDGKPRELAGSTQTFETPKLEPGKTFYYVFRSDLMRDGETKSEDRRVVVEAGKQVTVDFRGAMETTAAKR